MKRIDHKVAIVTGGGRNIGRAISLLFAREGAKLCIFDIDKSAGEDVVSSLRKEGHDCLFIYCDVTKIDEIKDAIAKVFEKYGRIDIMVNNVGEAIGTDLESIDEVTFYENIDVNLKSALFCTRTVLPIMKDQRSGSVIFISSVNALLGGFSETAYASAKGALHSLVRSLTADYSSYNIRFNVICPGSVPGDSKTWEDRVSSNPGLLKSLSALYPLRRYGDPIDVAYAALFFASDEASWITGVVLPVDGGISATGGFSGKEWWYCL